MQLQAFILISIIIQQTMAIPAYELHQSTLQSAQEGHRVSGIMFYAPWCSYSKQLSPTWDKLSEMASSNPDRDILLGKLDCVLNADVYYKEKIEVFPTIKFYFYGLPLVYEGEKDEESIKEYIEFLDNDNIDDIESSDSFELFKSMKLTTKTPLLLGFFSESTKLSLYFAYVCKRFRWAACGMSENFHFAEKLTNQTLDAIVLIRSIPNESDTVIYKGEETLSTLMAWFIHNAYPLVTPFTSENRAMMFNKNRPGFENHMISVIDTSNQQNNLIGSLQSLARGYIGRCLFITIDIASSEFEVEVLQQLGVSLDDVPMSVMVASSNDKVHVYGLGSTVDEQTLRDNINNFFSGHLSGTPLDFQDPQEKEL